MNPGITFYFEWEPVFMQWLQSIAGNIGVKLASFFTLFGEELVLIAVLGFIYWCYDKELGKTLGQIIVVGLVWNPMLKNVVLRRRPYFDNPGVKCLRPVVSDADIILVHRDFPSQVDILQMLLLYMVLCLYIRERKFCGGLLYH